MYSHLTCKKAIALSNQNNSEVLMFIIKKIQCKACYEFQSCDFLCHAWMKNVLQNV